MVAWGSEVISRVLAAVQRIPYGTSSAARDEDWSGAACFSAADRRAVRRAHRDWVISYMDKGDTTFVAYCKKGYAMALLANVENADIYRVEPRSHQQVAAADTWFIGMRHFQLYIRNRTWTALPYYAMIAKLHKQPFGNRFLVCSKRAPIAPLSLWLTYFLRGVGSVLDRMWQDVFAGGHEEACPGDGSWVLANTQSLLPLIHIFNNTFTPSVHDCIIAHGVGGQHI
jgi:hypothetical protein